MFKLFSILKVMELSSPIEGVIRTPIKIAIIALLNYQSILYWGPEITQVYPSQGNFDFLESCYT